MENIFFDNGCSKSQEILESLIVDAMRVDFRNWFRENYVNGIGRACGSDGSLFMNIHESGGPRIKRQRVAYTPETPEFTRSLITCIHSIAVKYNIDPMYTEKARIVQKWWRLSIRMVPNCNGTTTGEAKEHYLRWNRDTIDCPLTLEPIPVNDSVKIVSPEGRIVAYTCSALLKYFRETYDFRCPLLRFQYVMPQIRILQIRAFKLGIPALDLINAFVNREVRKEQLSEQDNALTGLERTCAEVFSNAIRIAEDDTIEQDDVYVKLEADVLPEWRAHVACFINMEPERCRAMLVVELSRIDEYIKRVLDKGITRDTSLPYLKQQIQEQIVLSDGVVTRRNRLLNGRYFGNENARTNGRYSLFSGTSPLHPLIRQIQRGLTRRDNRRRSQNTSGPRVDLNTNHNRSSVERHRTDNNIWGNNRGVNRRLDFSSPPRPIPQALQFPSFHQDLLNNLNNSNTSTELSVSSTNSDLPLSSPSHVTTIRPPLVQNNFSYSSPTTNPFPLYRPDPPPRYTPSPYVSNGQVHSPVS